MSDGKLLKEANDLIEKSELVSRTRLCVDAYSQIFTDILLIPSYDYLTLYLMVEDGVIYISDQREVFSKLDGSYEFLPGDHDFLEHLIEVGKKYNLEDNGAGFWYTVKENTLEELEKGLLAYKGLVEEIEDEEGNR